MEHVAGGLLEAMWRFTREVGLALAIVTFGLAALFGAAMAGDAVVEHGPAPLVAAPMVGTALAAAAGGRRMVHIVLAALVSGLTTFAVAVALTFLSFF